MPLAQNDIESELSYAYLHAVASRAGLNCKVENRHGDNYGVDAIVDHFGPIPDTYITDVSLRVQLKATINKGSEKNNHISYLFKGASQYDRLRTNCGQPHRILIVLFLPKEPENWLHLSEQELLLKQAAYWVSLYGAEAMAPDAASKTVYLPKNHLLTPQSINLLCQEIGKGNIPNYKLP